MITAAQYLTTRTLAAALGHRWARLDETATIPTPTTPTLIRKVSIQAILEAVARDLDLGRPHPPSTWGAPITSTRVR